MRLPMQNEAARRLPSRFAAVGGRVRSSQAATPRGPGSIAVAPTPPEPFGIDCGCWEDPSTGQCVEYSCSCDDPFSCIALRVGCAITGGDWGGWDDDECTWSPIRQGLRFRAL